MTNEFRPWRIDTRGIYFVCTDGVVELAPAFEHKTTAYEVMSNYLSMYPFFDRIPLVPFGTPVPRTKEHLELVIKG